MEKTIYFIIALLAFTSFSPVHAELRTFTREYTYQASEIDSKVSCRTIALEQVKRLLLEEIGTYIESHTEFKNQYIEIDEIKTLTAGVVRAVLTDEKWDGKIYWLKAKIEADPQEVLKAVESIRRDKETIRLIQEARNMANAALKEIGVLEATEDESGNIWIGKNSGNMKKVKLIPVAQTDRYNAALKQLKEADELEKKLYLNYYSGN